MKFGLIGHPIEHSLSPALFKAGYNGLYPYDLIETPDFDEAYSVFLKDYDGINVTAPFKEQAIRKADILSEECQAIGATNLLVKTPEGIKAYNSDYLGVRLWLQETLSQLSDAVTVAGKRATPLAAGGGAHEVGGVLSETVTASDSTTGKHACVLVVGCGGAGKAAAAAAVSLGLETVLMNRNMDRAVQLQENLAEMGHETAVRAISDFRTCFAEADIIIYNIPSAIDEIETLTDSDFGAGRPKHILEANYKAPSFDSAFIRKMQEANPEATYTGGRTWLLYQAVTGYEIFTGEKPDLKKMSDVL